MDLPRLRALVERWGFRPIAPMFEAACQSAVFFSSPDTLSSVVALQRNRGEESAPRYIIDKIQSRLRSHLKIDSNLANQVVQLTNILGRLATSPAAVVSAAGEREDHATLRPR